MLKEAIHRWSATDASELYDVARWGKGYFSIHESGHLLVHPEKNPRRSIDLALLVEQIGQRGVDLPVLLRFGGILQDRLREIHDAFGKAIHDHNYIGGYTCVYPVKVNPQRQVVEEVLKYGRRYAVGLEAGSKPELLAVVALAGPTTPIICNGFKDAEYIETALLAQKIGRRVIPVVERFTELELILATAGRLGVRPRIGVRVKLAARGAGRWQSSAGYRSKFGLCASEILATLDELKRRGMQDCLRMLHFHLGSQVTNIRRVKGALIEAARIYVDLAERGAHLEYLDVGGGLGVDYDGSQTNFTSSVNYTLQEYANDVVYHVQTVCDEAGVPHPHLISESGRAVVAYHSVLVFNVVGTTSATGSQPPDKLPDGAEQPLVDLMDTYHDLTTRNLLESYHDAQQAFDTALNLFDTGHLPLDERCMVENLFWAICRKIHRLAEALDFLPEELEGLDSLLAETYYCNFSLFQSIPDSWAIKQLFPVMPIHRLQQQPTQHAVLADITCDSDGKIDRFIDRRDVKRTLRLHEFDGKPYCLAAFLVGAYQEILGDLHNLFGDTNAVHVNLDESGSVLLDPIIQGDTVRDVLRYVQLDEDKLIRQLTSAINEALQTGRLDQQEADRMLKFYQDRLHSYTYLQEPDMKEMMKEEC